MDDQTARASSLLSERLAERGSHAAAEDDRDRAVLLWISRFRFVTDELVAERFGVSRQMMNARLKRLADAGHVERHSSGPTVAQLVSLSRRGADALGLPRRRAPRTDTQRAHELALVWLTSKLEREEGATVLTEREIRTREAAGRDRFSVRVSAPGQAPTKRWPDLVLEHPDGSRTAIELELTAKGATRLRRIASAYATASTYAQVRFLAADEAIERRVTAATAAVEVRLPPTLERHRHGATLMVERWPVGVSAARG